MDNSTGRRVATEPSVHVETRLEARQAAQGSAPQNIGTKGRKRPRRPLSKLRKISIAVLVVGVLALIGGGVFFGIKMFGRQELADDATFLTEVGAWQREDEPSVIWDFTSVSSGDEAGKGQLTTNAHENDYDFEWLLTDDQLAINTDWLYELNDTFSYTLDQENKKLTLDANGKNWTFVPAESAGSSSNSGSSDDSGANPSASKLKSMQNADDDSEVLEESVEDTVEY